MMQAKGCAYAGATGPGPSRVLSSKAHSVTFSRAGIKPCNGLAHHVQQLLITLNRHMHMVYAYGVYIWGVRMSNIGHN